MWQEWEAIYVDVANPHYKRPPDNSMTSIARKWIRRRVLWPEEEDLYALMCMRAEGGRTAFEREKQNSPVNPEMCEWPEEYFGDGIWFDDWPGRLVVKTLALDPSKGVDARRGDYSALVMLGVDGQGIIYVEADLSAGPRRKSWPTGWNCSAVSGRMFSASRPTSFKTFWPVSSRRSFAGRAFSARGPGRSKIAPTNWSASAAWDRIYPAGG